MWNSARCSDATRIRRTTSSSREYITYIGETGNLDLVEAVERVERGVSENHSAPIRHFLRGKRRAARQHGILVLLVLREQRVLLLQNPITPPPARNRSPATPQTRKTAPRSRTETSAAASTLTSPRDSHHVGVGQLLLPRGEQKPQNDAVDQRNAHRELQVRRRLAVPAFSAQLFGLDSRETARAPRRLVLRFHASRRVP